MKKLKELPLGPRHRAALLQVGVTPDTDAARKIATTCLGWRFVERVDDGVWNVQTPQKWPVNTDATITLSHYTGGVELNVEWP